MVRCEVVCAVKKRRTDDVALRSRRSKRERRRLEESISGSKEGSRLRVVIVVEAFATMSKL